MQLQREDTISYLQLYREVCVSCVKFVCLDPPGAQAGWTQQSKLCVCVCSAVAVSAHTHGHNIWPERGEPL